MPAQIMRVRDVGSKGVIKDLPAFELPPEAWSDAINIRFRAHRAEKFGGYFPVLTEGMPAEPPLAILYRNNTSHQIYGTSKSIYLMDGTRHINVSKLSNPSDASSQITYAAAPESTWYYTTLSNAIIMNTPANVPQGLTPSGTNFVDLPGWGRPQGTDAGKPTVDWKCGRIRAFKNYLIALDMREAGITLPQRVRWSNVAQVNELPPDWIETDETKDGGFTDLTDANGHIVDGVPLRDSFVIYTDKETYLMDYVGGLLIFSFKKLFSDSGILAPECAVEFEGKHFVVAKDDIFIHNGSSRQPVASGRMKKYLINEISSTNPKATKVFAYAPAKEVWISYVGSGRGGVDEWKCNKCAVWNWEWDTWTFYELPLSYDINMAPPPNLTETTWNSYTQPDDKWDSAKHAKRVWSELGKDFIKNIPYVASPDGCLYTVDSGTDQITYNKTNNSVTTNKVVAELQRYHLDMDEQVASIRLHKFVTTVAPQFRGKGQVIFQVGGSYNPTDEPTWDSYQIFDIENDVKVDAYSNNRYPAFKITDTSGGDWSMQGYDVEYVIEGNR